MITTEQLKSLSTTAHQIAVSKKFWEDGVQRNKGEMVMLIITELAEAVEAHRKGRFVLVVDAAWMAASSDESHLYEEYFPEKIKDTFEDEIADALIRIFDYCHGWKLMIYDRDYRKESTGNVAEDILRLTHYVMSAYHNVNGKDWGYAIAAIQAFCIWYKIDIYNHVVWKMNFNKTRPVKHGKAY